MNFYKEVKTNENSCKVRRAIYTKNKILIDSFFVFFKFPFERNCFNYSNVNRVARNFAKLA